MNLQKTKILSPGDLRISVGSQDLEVVDQYIYLGHNIKIGKANQNAEVSRRVGLTWAAFGRLGFILRDSAMPINFKRKVYESCVLPATTYGTETLALTKAKTNQLRICQRAMERAMMGISLRDRVRNEVIRRRSGVTDVVERMARQNGAGRGTWRGRTIQDGQRG